MNKPCKASWRDYPNEVDITVPVKGEDDMKLVVALVDHRDQIVAALNNAWDILDGRLTQQDYDHEADGTPEEHHDPETCPYCTVKAALELVKGEEP